MIYIHIPYCRSFCTYCDFYSVIPDCGFEAFVNALCSEITARRREIPWDHNTLYIGGGTPSVLPLYGIRRVVEILEASRAEADIGATGRSVIRTDGTLTHFDEFTVEVNPDDIVAQGAEYVRGLAELGVNRISMGVQSLDDRVLKWMNRRHTAASAREAYRIIRSAGIGNISVDLIFGFGDIGADAFPSGSAGKRFDSTETLIKTLDGFLNIGDDGMPPRHISAYQLSIEPGSELAEMVGRGEYVPASDEVCAEQYEIICGRLGSAGYRHYEISNFAQVGFEAKHNSAYWRHIPYIGFGPAAHSFFTNYVRRWNKANVCGYIRAAEAGDWNSISDGETLTAEQIREERIMLALRTDAGIPASEIPNAGKFVENGLLEVAAPPDTADAVAEPHLRIPENKFFISDSIIADLI